MFTSDIGLLLLWSSPPPKNIDSLRNSAQLGAAATCL